MVDTIKATELVVQQYIASIGLNPDNVYYQRIASTNISLNQAQWQIISPNKRANLLSLGWINWKPTITKTTDAGVPENFVNNGIHANFKSGLPFTNAMSSIETTTNSATMTISQPRRFAEHLCMMFGGRKGTRNCFGTCGGEFRGLNGYSDNQAATRNLLTTGHPQIDIPFFHNEERFAEKLSRAAGAINLNGLNNLQINCMEPIFSPPFNPFAKLKEGMPEYCWFKHMSPVIPSVSRLEINCQFQNISQAVLHARYLRTGANALKRLTISALAADLILYWYNPPSKMVMPRQVQLQSWNVREFITPITGLGAQGIVDNGLVVTSVETDLLQLHNVPSLIVIHAEVDKDSTSYSSRALHVDDNQAGNVVTLSANSNSMDSYMEITNFEVILGDRPQVISRSFTQDELYYLTIKNSKINDFPYSFDSWRGRVIPESVAAGTAYTQMSKMFIALRPKDLSEKFGPGVRFPTSLQFKMDVTARDGYGNLGALNAANNGGGNKRYKLYIHVYSGKHFLNLTSDSGQYQEQQISAEKALQQQDLVVDSSGGSIGAGLVSGGRIRVDEPRYVSRV